MRCEDGINVTREDIEALANWDAKATPEREIAFTPARVLMQDFTGVPAVVDLAAMRDAMQALGGDPARINPLSPAELVIDHSVMVDVFGTKNAADENARIEFDRNKERYAFLRWGQAAFSNFAVVPPDTGIVHQVNLEVPRTVFARDADGKLLAYPDTVVGTDSHTTMIRPGRPRLGSTIGIEAEAAMLGQPITMLIPQTVGFPPDRQPGGARRDRPRAARDRNAAQEGRGRQIRRILRPRPRSPAPRRPCDLANMAPEWRDRPVRSTPKPSALILRPQREQVALVEACPCHRDVA